MVDAAYPLTGHVGRDVEENVAIHCWMLHSQMFFHSSNNKQEHLLFPLVKQSLRITFYSVCPSLNLFPLCWWAPGLANWRVPSRSRRRKQGRHGSEEVCGWWGLSSSSLSVVHQEVNYVSVGGRLCHRLCCLSILGKNREKMSQRHMEDIAVAFLSLTVAVSCHFMSSNWTWK